MAGISAAVASRMVNAISRGASEVAVILTLPCPHLAFRPCYPAAVELRLRVVAPGPLCPPRAPRPASNSPLSTVRPPGHRRAPADHRAVAVHPAGGQLTSRLDGQVTSRPDCPDLRGLPSQPAPPSARPRCARPSPRTHHLRPACAAARARRSFPEAASSAWSSTARATPQRPGTAASRPGRAGRTCRTPPCLVCRCFPAAARAPGPPWLSPRRPAAAGTSCGLLRNAGEQVVLRQRGVDQRVHQLVFLGRPELTLQLDRYREPARIRVDLCGVRLQCLVPHLEVVGALHSRGDPLHHVRTVRIPALEPVLVR